MALRKVAPHAYRSKVIYVCKIIGGYEQVRSCFLSPFFYVLLSSVVAVSLMGMKQTIIIPGIDSKKLIPKKNPYPSQAVKKPLVTPA